MRSGEFSGKRPAETSAGLAITILSFGLVANLAPLMTFAATLPQISPAWGLSAGEAGWIGGIYFAGYAAAVPLLTGATDHIDGRWLYAGSALLGATASLAFGLWVHDFVPALVFRFLGGIALAGVHMPGLKLLVDRTSSSSQGRGTAVYTSCYAAGNATSFLLAGVVDSALGWRAAFVIAGFVPLLSIVALVFLPAELPLRREADRRLFEIRPLLRNRPLMAYIAAFAGNTWEVFAVRVWFVACLSWILSLPGNALSLPALGVVAGIAALAGVPASIVVAELATHHGRRRVIIFTCLVSVMVCLALAATAGGPVLIVLPLLILVQITSFADVGALAGGAVAAADPERRGAALAFYALAGFASGFLGPVAVGTVLDAFGGAQSAAGWVAAFMVMALGSAAAAGAVWHARD